MLLNRATQREGLEALFAQGEPNTRPTSRIPTGLGTRQPQGIIHRWFSSSSDDKSQKPLRQRVPFISYGISSFLCCRFALVPGEAQPTQRKGAQNRDSFPRFRERFVSHVHVPDESATKHAMTVFRKQPEPITKRPNFTCASSWLSACGDRLSEPWPRQRAWRGSGHTRSA